MTVFYLMMHSTHLYQFMSEDLSRLQEARMDDSVLFNDALNTFISIYVRRIIEITGSKE